MDTDTLLLRPVEDLWRHFESFGAKQLASMTPEGEVTESNWYPRFARHPFYGKNGVNSGVMLMNLTRMRTVHWEDKILPIYRKYKFQITWGDQDILNILFHEYPGKVLDRYIYHFSNIFRQGSLIFRRLEVVRSPRGGSERTTSSRLKIRLQARGLLAILKPFKNINQTLVSLEFKMY